MHKTDVMKKRILIALTVTVALGGIAFVGMMELRPASLSHTASMIVADCAKQQDHAACYETEVPSLYPKLGVSEIFDIVREIRKLDTSYQFCHVLGHKIGERVVAEDPSGWVNAIPLNPADGLCSNGFIHGVVGGRFRSEVLDDTTIQKFLPDFKIACTAHDNWQPSDLDRAICYHGIGHLFDFITNADIPKALSLCSSVAPESFKRVCVQGVFMQIYQPLEPDDYALIEQMPLKPSTTTVASYCRHFSADPMAQGSCIEESWPLRTQQILDGTGVASLCALEPNAEETDNCYIAMSSIIGRMNLGGNGGGTAATACNNFPASRRAQCYAYSAEAVLEESRSDATPAIALCKRSASEDTQTQCLSMLIQHARFMFGSNQTQMNGFCAALPDEFESSCDANAQLPTTR